MSKKSKSSGLHVGIVSFAYGGNGGIASEVPYVREWMIKTFMLAQKDTRISKISDVTLSDTPITMTRNQAVVWALHQEVDVLVMVDSDMKPDCEAGEDPEAKPFFPTAFDFVHDNYHKGSHPVAVCAPYCGGPPQENVYVFEWSTGETGDPSMRAGLAQYGREEASRMSGIQPIAAAPTGLIMFDMRMFDLTDPVAQFEHYAAQGYDTATAQKLVRSWFYYEYTSILQVEKASTEDVTATRDMSMVGWELHKTDTVFCAWDCWAAHMKPKIVRKPRALGGDQVAGAFAAAVSSGSHSQARLVNLEATETNGKI